MPETLPVRWWHIRWFLTDSYDSWLFHCVFSPQNRHRSDKHVNNRKVQVLIDRKWVSTCTLVYSCAVRHGKCLEIQIRFAQGDFMASLYLYFKETRPPKILKFIVQIQHLSHIWNTRHQVNRIQSDGASLFCSCFLWLFLVKQYKDGLTGWKSLHVWCPSSVLAVLPLAAGLQPCAHWLGARWEAAAGWQEAIVFFLLHSFCFDVRGLLDWAGPGLQTKVSF